jgi:two-component system, chemotaxis family, protein-glutamate methylesterase/glutaminase
MPLSDSPSSRPPIRVLVVDDSILIRNVLREIINEAPDLTCVGEAPDAATARERIRTLNPDVITLDVEMPGMDGLDFLEKLMRLRPMPVVMVSSLTERGSDVAIRALELGAVEVIAKPKALGGTGLLQSAHRIQDALRAAALARLPKTRKPPPLAAGSGALHRLDSTLAAGDVTARAQALGGSRPFGTLPPKPAPSTQASGRLIAIGASTGGTEAIKEVLQVLPTTLPGIVITQHMPERFTRSFAERLDKLCAIHVKEAEEGDVIRVGCAYVAPGHSHLSITRMANQWVCHLSQDPPVNRHRPSVDVLFDAVARLLGPKALGVLLTGMGRDGASGLLQMHKAGALTLAQNEASCVVYGMPREAVALGAASEVADLERISTRLVEWGRS